MNDTLKLLYDRFYTPLPMEETEQEIDDCHRQLIERLEKPERKLVLRIIDAQNLIAERRSVDSFLCGFQLAWEVAYGKRKNSRRLVRVKWLCQTIRV